MDGVGPWGSSAHVEDGKQDRTRKLVCHRSLLLIRQNYAVVRWATASRDQEAVIEKQKAGLSVAPADQITAAT